MTHRKSRKRTTGRKARMVTAYAAVDWHGQIDIGNIFKKKTDVPMIEGDRIARVVIMECPRCTHGKGFNCRICWPRPA